MLLFFVLFCFFKKTPTWIIVSSLKWWKRIGKKSTSWKVGGRIWTPCWTQPKGLRKQRNHTRKYTTDLNTSKHHRVRPSYVFEMTFSFEWCLTCRITKTLLAVWSTVYFWKWNVLGQMWEELREKEWTPNEWMQFMMPFSKSVQLRSLSKKNASGRYVLMASMIKIGILQ